MYPLNFGRTARVCVAVSLASLMAAHWPQLSAASPSAVVTESELLAWTGDTDSDPRALAILPDGRLVFFEDEPGAGSAEDAVIVVDPALSGANKFSVAATEDDVVALAPNGTTSNLHVSDIAIAPSGDLYLAATERSSGNFDNYIVKLPFAAGSFGPPILVTDVFDGGDDGSSRTQHRLVVDAARNRLFILYDNLDPVNDAAGGHGANGVYTFDLARAPGTTSDLVLFAPYTAVAAAVTPPAIVGAESTGLWQIRADSQGNLLGVHSEGSGDNDGDIVRIDATSGAATLWKDQFEAELATGNLSQFSGTTNLAIHPVNDDVYLFETGTSTEQRENVYIFDASGNLIEMLIAHDEVTDALSTVSPTFTTTSSNALTVDGTGRTYFFLHSSPETLVYVDPTGTCGPATALTYIWPTGSSTPPDPSSPYGPRQLVSGNYRHDWHRGVDIAMPYGSDLHAVADGVVENAGNLSGFTEPVVILRHGECPPYVYSYYLHMSAVSVAKEDVVMQGQLVGQSGQSASGFEHVHFETRVGCNSQSCCRNPYEVLPYANVPAPLPSLVGGNAQDAGIVLLLEVNVPDSQIDLNGIDVHWGGTNMHWDWQVVNRGNSPSFAAALDRPVTDHGGGLHNAIWPDHMNQASTGARYQVAIAGLDPSVSSGEVSVLDIHAAGPPLSVELTPNDTQLCPASQELSAQPGDSVTFQHVLTNDGVSSHTITLSARSANNNSVTVSPTDVTLAPGDSATITVDLTLDVFHAPGIGDAVLLEADSGSGLRSVALDTVCLDDTCVTPPPPPSTQNALAQGDNNVSGTVSGNFSATHASDNNYETITEVESGGKGNKRTSQLEHSWTFNVPQGSLHRFKVEAYRSDASAEDDFVFAYSLDGGTFYDMLTVSKTVDDGVAQTFILPSTAGGQTVTVRVRDTDRTRGLRTLDSIHVDGLYIITEGVQSGGDPLASCETPLGSGYTVSSIVLSTVSAGKGKKHGRATVSIVDGAGNPAAGVSVTGTFTGAYQETHTETTDASGVAVFTTTAAIKGGGEFGFVVESIGS